MSAVPRTLICPTCGAELNPTEPNCPACGELVRADPDEMVADILERAGKRRFPIPWGLFLLLGLYFGAVWGFLQYQYYNAPQYQAARHMRIATQLLGSDDGATADVPALLEALDHMLAALNVNPDDSLTHERIQTVVRLLKERNTVLPDDKQKLLDALALRYRRMHETSTDIVWIGPRDIWDLDSILDMPAKILRYSVIGGVVILLLWLYKTWQDHKYLERLAAERMEERREEAAASAASHQRRRR
jgi:hypothetical protein